MPLEPQAKNGDRIGHSLLVRPSALSSLIANPHRRTKISRSLVTSSLPQQPQPSGLPARLLQCFLPQGISFSLSFSLWLSLSLTLSFSLYLNWNEMNETLSLFLFFNKTNSLSFLNWVCDWPNFSFINFFYLFLTFWIWLYQFILSVGVGVCRVLVLVRYLLSLV